MAGPTILVCACGMRLKAAGAVPGRVGKCPACGGLLRVPDAPVTAPEAPEDVPPTPEASADAPGAYAVASRRPTSYTASRGRGPAPPSSSRETTIWDGFVRVPAQPEERIRESLLYPLWGASGVALLVFLPPLLWFTSIPFLSLVNATGTGTPIQQLSALLALLPTGMGLLLVGSYTLLFLGRVLVSSAIGEVHHPRWPDWELSESARGLGRWVWALAVGGVIGGLPAMVYWLYCGDVDLFDRVILAELIAVGAAYGELALLASLLHDDPLGANPITVLRAFWRVRWGCLPPALVIGFAVMVAAGGLAAVLGIDNPPLAAAAFWAYWVGLLYGSMVVLRVLGLFYHRHARVLGWFRDRPRWGA